MIYVVTLHGSLVTRKSLPRNVFHTLNIQDSESVSLEWLYESFYCLNPN